jgi:hypothetical protein
VRRRHPLPLPPVFTAFADRPLSATDSRCPIPAAVTDQTYLTGRIPSVNPTNSLAHLHCFLLITANY